MSLSSLSARLETFKSFRSSSGILIGFSVLPSNSDSLIEEEAKKADGRCFFGVLLGSSRVYLLRKRTKPISWKEEWKRE
jgi:hypothetical protein